MLPQEFTNSSNLVTIIGRGHSGTRAMSSTLSESGVFMGSPLNVSSDLIPPEDMYEACRVIGHHVEYKGGLDWDFSKLHTCPIDPAFTSLIESYLQSIINSSSPWRGWKIPETTLCYPWIVRLFPNMRYIHWVRDPRDCILKAHVTDDLSDFNIKTPECQDHFEQRAVSWIYQTKLMAATPEPKYITRVRFEDFVLNQQDTLKQLTEFLDIDLATIPVKPEAIGRWKTSNDHHEIEMLKPYLEQMGY